VLLVRQKPLSYVLREGSFRLQLRVELLNGAGFRSSKRSQSGRSQAEVGD
jgi:hypothetical protein